MENKDIYISTRYLNILEAAFEYFISIIVSGAYLAKITSSLEISDSLTGIISSFISLGCGFQIIAIFLTNKRPVKRWVTFIAFMTDICFAMLYFIPFINISKTARTLLFVSFMLIGHSISRISSAPKSHWFMSLVDDNKRGSFTASKEMFSLIGGMIFTFAMGAIIDKYEAAGNREGAFITCGISIFVLMILRSTCLLLSKEKPVEDSEKKSIGHLITQLITDKNLIKVIGITVLWNIVNYASTPFYGSYQIKELGFTMTFISVLSAAYAIIRTLVSKPIGRFADKHSFSSMLNICFVIMLAGFIINIFTVPENGKIFFTAYYILSAIAMAGINGSTINLIFDYVEEEKRVGAIALQGTLSGLAGFFTTLAVTPIVTRIQANGNTIFGINVYAQQVVSAISTVLLIFLIIYLNLVVRRVKR